MLVILELVKYAIHAVFLHICNHKIIFQADITMTENSIMQHILVFPCGTCTCESILRQYLVGLSDYHDSIRYCDSLGLFTIVMVDYLTI